MRTRLLIFLAGLILLAVAACSSEEPVVQSPGGPLGTLAGSVTIGPLCPVEPCANENGDTYSSRQLQLQSESSSGILVPLRSDGTFRASVPVGEYVVTVSNCDFLGCSTSLPVTVVITDGETSDLRIDIDTGIRSVARAETSYARLIDDLRGAGADVAPSSDIIQPFFGVTGQVLTVNGNDVQVFEFPSVDAAQAEVNLRMHGGKRTRRGDHFPDEHVRTCHGFNAGPDPEAITGRAFQSDGHPMPVLDRWIHQALESVEGL